LADVQSPSILQSDRILVFPPCPEVWRERGFLQWGVALPNSN